MKKLLVLLICIFSLSSVCFGISETKKISLDKAIEIALKENPQNKMAKLDTQIAKEDVKAAGQWKNPAVQFFQNLGKAGAGNPQQIGLSYEFELLKPSKRKKAAKFNVDIADNNRKFCENELILKVKTAYFNLLESKTNLEIIESQRNISKQIYENAQKEADLGHLPKTEAILAKIEYNRSQMFHNEAKSLLISTRNKFNAVMNSSELEFDTVQDKLSDDFSAFLTIKPSEAKLDFQEIKQFTLSHRYDIISAKKEVEAKKAELSKIKSQLIPDLELHGGWSYQTPSVSESSEFENGAYIGANLVNIPLIYRYKPEIEKANREIEKAQLKYQDLMIDVIRNITDAYENYSIARDNINFYDKELLKNSRELVEASLTSLKKKEITMSEFLLLRKMYLELLFGYSNALKSYYIAYAELLKEMNISDIKEMEKEKI